MTGRHHSRRTVLTSAVTSFGLLGFLAACQPGSKTPAAPPQVAQDIALIAQGLAAVANSLTGIPGIPADTLAKIKGDITKIQTAAASVATDTTGSAWPTNVQGITSLIGEIADVALPLIPGGAPFVLAVNAAQALVPILLAAIGVVGAKPGPAGVTPEQARLTLSAAAAGVLH